MPRLIPHLSSFILCLGTLTAQTPPSDPLPATPVPATSSTPAPQASSQLRVSGDLITMTTDPDERRHILFQGKVKIFGGDLTGTCDRLEIIGPDPGAPSPLPPSSVSPLKSASLPSGTAISAFSKVVATGNVTITSAKHTAFAERAEIYPSPSNPGQPEKLVLSGKPKLTDGTQQITGGLITYRLSQTQVDVETDPAHPDERPTVILESFP